MTTPTPASPAAVCARLRTTLASIGNHAAGLIFKDDLTAALALISQGEKERERVERLRFALFEIGDACTNGEPISMLWAKTALQEDAARAQPTPESK